MIAGDATFLGARHKSVLEQSSKTPMRVSRRYLIGVHARRSDYCRNRDSGTVGDCLQYLTESLGSWGIAQMAQKVESSGPFQPFSSLGRYETLAMGISLFGGKVAKTLLQGHVEYCVRKSLLTRGSFCHLNRFSPQFFVAFYNHRPTIMIFCRLPCCSSHLPPKRWVAYKGLDLLT